MQLKDITDLVLAALGLICSITTTFLIPWLRQKAEEKKIFNSKAKLDQVFDMIQVFVSAAEQIYDRSQGQEKKDYVLKLITKTLAERGLSLDLEELEAAIEKSVLELHSQLYDYPAVKN